MLPQRWRMRRSQDFKEVMRHGKRARSKYFMVHYKADQRLGGLVGFVVPKKEIALASDRNRVKRQLRHIVGQRITNKIITDQDVLVLRVFRRAHGASFEKLSLAFDKCLADVKSVEAGPESSSKNMITKEVVK
ncbi:MAG: ribonuclease P protein component [Vagococcus sp.]|nr:ribonuclease P protein component [Vagococcus sp.]